ncbi:MAG: ECF transporter S component [Chloroflexi bacterium]|nr:ECF transporter S component [Chloroflexota bacterium]
MNWLSGFPKAVAKKPLYLLLLIVFGALAYFGGVSGWPVILVAIGWGVAFYFAIAFVLTWAGLSGATSFAASYTTRDIVIMGALIAIGGVAKAYWGQLRLVLESVIGPYAEFVIGPGFYVWAILACQLVRKPLSGTISMVLGGVVEILAGTPLVCLFFSSMGGKDSVPISPTTLFSGTSGTTCWLRS